MGVLQAILNVMDFDMTMPKQFPPSDNGEQQYD